jgi:iron uptake system component EfeO
MLTAGALLAAAAVTAVVPTARGAQPAAHAVTTADGLPHTTVEVAPSGCGRGWTRPEPGRQVFDLHNTSGTAAEVYLTDAKTGAVYGEVEGLGPGTVGPTRVTLGGSYAFRCLPDDADASAAPRCGSPAPGCGAVRPPFR